MYNFLNTTKLEWKLNHHIGLLKLKYSARLLRKAYKYDENYDASYLTCLDIVSKQQGLSDWHHARDLVKQYYSKNPDELTTKHQLITLASDSGASVSHDNLYIGYDELLDLHVYTTASLQRSHLFAQGPKAYTLAMTQQWQQHALNKKAYVVWMYEPTDSMIEDIKTVINQHTHIIAIGKTTMPASLHAYQRSWNSEILDSPHTVFILDDGTDKKAHHRQLHHFKEHIAQALGQPIDPLHSTISLDRGERQSNKHMYFGNPSEDTLESLAPIMAQARGYGAACVYAYTNKYIPQTQALNMTTANTLTHLTDIDDTSKVKCLVGQEEHVINGVLTR